jgi:hypothetical protein
MVLTRGHRGDPPKEATCYASVRRGGTEDPSLNAPKKSLLGHPFSWLSYKVSGHYKEMIMIGVLWIVVLIDVLSISSFVPALPSSPSQKVVTEYCLPKCQINCISCRQQNKHVPRVLLFVDGILSLPSFNCYLL